ncbi:MAG: rRNA maturation RNase YbeY [Candidatus Omnitrophota bacterium]
MIEIVDELYNLDLAFYIEKLDKVVDELKLNGTITIKVGDPEEALELNHHYLKRDYAADVLSFPFNEDLPDGYYIGDIFVCYKVAEEQAKEADIALEEELFTLMTHGVLHLAGYDHETDNGEMLALQEKLVNQYFHQKN